MKLNIVKAISIAGLVFISQLTQAQAAPSVPVIDTFVVGQPLTAAQLNTIKALAEYNTSSISSNTSSINALNTPAVYAIGDTGPAGGIVFYVTGDGLHGLEAAPSDSAPAEWDCFGTLLSGMNETGVGSGAHNTSQRDLCSDASTAAKVAAAYEFNGYIDWFLPSKDELNLMWTNLADPERDGRDVGFDGDSLGGFASNYYWSSSQSNSNYAWTQSFDDGNQYASIKLNSLRVRAVRAF
jgi:hypothetical protein